MILDIPIFELKINWGMALVIILGVAIVALLLKLIISKLRRYSGKFLFKVVFFTFLTALAFSLIISSVIFFYKTAITTMLIPSAIGLVLLVADAIVYVLFFENKGVY